MIIQCRKNQNAAKRFSGLSVSNYPLIGGLHMDAAGRKKTQKQYQKDKESRP